jgi:hypothetical protein
MHLKTTMTISLAAVLAVSMVMTTPVFASTGLAKKNPDFDITTVTDDTMTVVGTAGGTTPKDQTHVFAYVFVQNTCLTSARTFDACAYAVTSHMAEDSDQVGNDITWHTHYVELTNGCVSHIEDAGTTPTMISHTVTLNGVTPDTAAGLTAVLNIEFDTGSVCVQSVLDGPVTAT